jgi:hypothetical protein
MTDEDRIPEFLARMRSARERTREVGQQLVGLTLDDAAELAARSGCQLRVMRTRRKGRASDGGLRDKPNRRGGPG